MKSFLPALLLAAVFSACLLEDKDIGDVQESTDPGTNGAPGNFAAPEGVAVGGGLVFVANTSFDTPSNTFGPGFVTVVGAADLVVKNKISTSASNPQELAVLGGSLIVLCSGETELDKEAGLVRPVSDGSIEIIDIGRAASAFSPDTVIPLPRSGSMPLVGYPSSMAVTADGRFAYLGSGTSPAVFKVDLENRTVIRGASDPIQLGDLSTQDTITVEPGPGGVVFAGSYAKDIVYAIDTATDTQAAAPFQFIEVGGQASGIHGLLDIAYRDAQQLDMFVLLHQAHLVRSVTTVLGQAGVQDFATTGTGPNRIFTAGGKLYVVNSMDNNVTAFDIASASFLGKTAVFDPGTDPYDAALDADHGWLFVTGFSSDSLFRVDIASGSRVEIR